MTCVKIKDGRNNKNEIKKNNLFMIFYINSLLNLFNILKNESNDIEVK
ncbi:MAG: hypothetical protein WC358_02475 [Ignavibacteria bacterium]